MNFIVYLFIKKKVRHYHAKLIMSNDGVFVSGCIGVSYGCKKRLIDILIWTHDILVKTTHCRQLVLILYGFLASLRVIKVPHAKTWCGYWCELSVVFSPLACSSRMSFLLVHRERKHYIVWPPFNGEVQSLFFIVIYAHYLW